MLFWALIIALCVTPLTVLSFHTSAYVEAIATRETWSYFLLKDGAITLAYLGGNAPPKLAIRSSPTEPYQLWRMMFVQRVQQLLAMARVESTPYEEIRDEPATRKKYQSDKWISDQLAAVERSTNRELAGLRQRFGPLIDKFARDHGVLGLYLHLDTNPELDVFIRLPLWLPAAIAFLIVAWLFRETRLARRRRKKGLCVVCGYSMQGNVSGICPECGVELGPVASSTPVSVLTVES